MGNSSHFLLGRPRCEQYERLGTSFQAILGGWQGSINVCHVRDGVTVLLVLWYDEVHTIKNSFVLDGDLVDLWLA